MSEPLTREQWPFYLDSFNKHNQGRATELKIFNHLEIEHQLPLNGIYLEESGADAPKLEILLGGEAAGADHVTHIVAHVQSISPDAYGGRYEGLEIVDAHGIRTTLSFTVPHLLTAVAEVIEL